MPSNLPPSIDALLSAGARRFTVPMDRQPPSEIFDDGTGRWYPSGIPWGGEDWFAPYPPGTVLPVREEWRPVVQQAGTGMYSGTVCGMAEYRASKGELLKCKIVFACGECPGNWSSIWWGRDMPDDGWRPAETMPDWLARRHVVVTECRPVRVEEQWCWDVSVEPKGEPNVR